MIWASKGSFFPRGPKTRSKSQFHRGFSMVVTYLKLAAKNRENRVLRQKHDECALKNLKTRVFDLFKIWGGERDPGKLPCQAQALYPPFSAGPAAGELNAAHEKVLFLCVYIDQKCRPFFQPFEGKCMTKKFFWAEF